VDESPDEDGRFGGSVLFVRWSSEGDRPVGHVETPDLVHGASPEEADRLVRQLTLHEVKAALDRAVAAQSELEG
jgi:hypothetical protein